jgi:hypothetical protein
MRWANNKTRLKIKTYSHERRQIQLLDAGRVREIGHQEGEKVMRVKGIASTADVDSDGEILEPSGYDLSRLTTSGHINWNHLAKNDPSKIIGEPDVAKIVNNKLYIEGVLYKGHDLAESVWKYAETLNGNNSNIGWTGLSRDALYRDIL